MINVGQPAPNFTLVDQNRQKVTLSQFRMSKNVVLSFHIYSFTSGWTDQVSSFRAANPKFEEQDTQVLGISTDASATQNAFSTTMGNITYPLLSDFYPHGEVAQRYGVFNDEQGTPFRAVILIDKQGVIRFTQIYQRATDINIENILREVKKLQA
mgnify:CR=1 FL=1